MPMNQGMGMQQNMGMGMQQNMGIGNMGMGMQQNMGMQPNMGMQQNMQQGGMQNMGMQGGMIQGGQGLSKADCLNVQQLRMADVNGDGMLTQQELASMLVNTGGIPMMVAQQYANDFCRMAGSPCRVDAFINEYVRMSLFKTSQFFERNMALFDRDGDGMISFQEFTNMLCNVMDPQSAQMYAQVLIRRFPFSFCPFILIA